MKRTTLFYVLVFIILGASCARVRDKETREMPCLRIEYNFNSNWNFVVDSINIGKSESWNKLGIPKSKMRSVKIPHTWNVDEGLEDYVGAAWYEKDFFASEDYHNKIIRLKFGAINRNASIYLNGELVKFHEGAGYTTFYADLTKFIKIGEQNKVVIACDNNYSDSSIPYKSSFDWANDGGIYRDVHMIVSNKNAIDYVHITPVFAKESNGYSGVLHLKAKLFEHSNLNTETIQVALKVKEENQNTENTIYDKTLSLEKRGEFYIGSISLKKVNLWHFDYPNLYALKIGLLNDGEVIDDYSSITGFKKFEVKGSSFYLNDEPVRLTGVEWMPGSNPHKGLAEDSLEIHKMLSLLKETNSVFTRFHWQQDERVIDWCNRNGVLVQEEIPHWQKPNKLTKSVQASIKTNFNEMIIRDYNAPCIYSWGIGNELWGLSEEVYSFLEENAEYIRNNLDSTRLVSYTSNSLHKNPSIDASRVGDFLMWNDYQGTWHSQHTDSIGVLLDNMHLTNPNKPVVISEFGLCGSLFTGGDERLIQDMNTHIDYYASKDFVAGAIYFSLNDYRTQMGETGTKNYQHRIFGVSDLQGNKKKSFVELQNRWSPLDVEIIEKKETKISVKILCKSSLPTYSIKGYSLLVIKPNGEYERISIPSLSPRESVEIEVPLCDEIKVLRPTGFLCKSLRVS